MAEYDLSDLSPGESAVISFIGDETGIRGRLLDMGLTAGTDISCLFSSAWGEDPTAYRVRETVIALRKKDAAQIRIRKTEVLT